MSNPIFSWTSLTDSAGRKIRDYSLHFDNGFLDVMGKIYTPLTSMIWDGFMFLSVLAATLIGWIGNPEWLSGLDGAYRYLTSSFLNAVNPVVVSVGGFGVLVLYIVLDKAKTTSTSLDKNDINRIVAAVALMGFIAVMVMNPFVILKDALSVVQVIVATIAGKDSGSLSVFSVDAMIRQPTLIINYNGAVSSECADMWSEQGRLPASSHCYSSASASPETVILSIIAVLVSLITCAFAIWAMWKYIRHLSVAVMGFVSLSWVAAVSLFRRRQFDQLATVFAIACGNLVMVFAVQVISIGGPELVSKFMEDWGQSGYAILQMLLLGATYAILLGVLVMVTNKHGALSRALKTDANNALKIIGSPGRGRYANLDGRGLGWYRDSVIDRGRKMIFGTTNTNDRIIKGKSAEIDAVEDGDMKDSLEPVQSTLNLDRHGNLVLAADYLNGFLAMIELRKMMFESAMEVGLRAGFREGVSASLDNSLAVNALRRAVTGMDSRISRMGWSTNSVQAPEPGALRKRAESPLIGDIDDSLLSQLGRVIVLSNLISDNPEFGGLTSGDQSLSAVAEVLCEFLEHLRGMGRPVTVSPDGVVETFMDSRMSHTARMSAYTKSRLSMEKSSIAAIDPGGTDEGERVQNTMTGVPSSGSNVSPISSGALERYAPKVSRRLPNVMRGADVTRGDVGLTRTTTLCDRADSDHVIEESSLKARVQGVQGTVVISEKDFSQGVRFSPDSPISTVSPRCGVGFGDSIY